MVVVVPREAAAAMHTQRATPARTPSAAPNGESRPCESGIRRYSKLKSPLVRRCIPSTRRSRYRDKDHARADARVRAFLKCGCHEFVEDPCLGFSPGLEAPVLGFRV